MSEETPASTAGAARSASPLLPSNSPALSPSDIIFSPPWASASPQTIDCPICHETITDPENITFLGCHYFCNECIETWFQYREDYTCPVCRRPATTGLVIPLPFDNEIVYIPEELTARDRHAIMQPGNTGNALLAEYANVFRQLRPWRSILALTCAWFERRLELSEFYEVTSLATAAGVVQYLDMTNEYFIHWLNTPGTVPGVNRQIYSLLQNILGREVRPRELISFLKTWAHCWSIPDTSTSVNDWLKQVNSNQEPFDISERTIPRFFHHSEPPQLPVKMALIHLIHRSQDPDVTIADLDNNALSLDMDWYEWSI
jgi:hypothetical protein